VVDLGSEGLDTLRNALLDGVDAVAQCAGGGRVDRGTVAAVIQACLPPKLVVDRVRLNRDELMELVDRYYDRELMPKIPHVASDFFQPIEIFEPDTHCFRAWETTRIVDLMATLGDVCGSCRLTHEPF